jgi:cadmium resistance protein CadD (predicted permease)
MNLPKGKMLSFCNLAIFIILLLLLLHVLGYVEMRVKNREGMTETEKKFNTVILWLSVASGGLFILASTFTRSDNR